MNKGWLAALLAGWLLAACAQGGTTAANPQGGSITMYGTIDTGVTFRK